MTVRAATLPTLAALVLLAAGCGEDAEHEPPPPPPETVDPVRDLPDGWAVHVNRGGGFALGLPPGWTAQDRHTSTLVRSLDRLVAVSIVADRTREALEMPLDDFARRALIALPGYESELTPTQGRRFPHRYQGFRVEGQATATRTGVPQRVQLVVLRRGRHATFTAVIAARARGAEPSEAIAERMVRTLRSRPVSRGSG